MYNKSGRKCLGNRVWMFKREREREREREWCECVCITNSRHPQKNNDEITPRERPPDIFGSRTPPTPPTIPPVSITTNAIAPNIEVWSS